MLRGLLLERERRRLKELEEKELWIEASVCVGVVSRVNILVEASSCSYFIAKRS